LPPSASGLSLSTRPSRGGGVSEQDGAYRLGGDALGGELPAATAQVNFARFRPGQSDPSAPCHFLFWSRGWPPVWQIYDIKRRTAPTRCCLAGNPPRTSRWTPPTSERTFPVDLVFGFIGLRVDCGGRRVRLASRRNWFHVV
jgi:hypothetical protein